MNFEEWIKFLVPIIVPILIPLVTGGGVFWIIYKERIDREERKRKEDENFIKNKADAAASITNAGAELAKDTGDIYQGIIAQLQADLKDIRATVSGLQVVIEDLKKEIIKKDNKFIRLVQAVRRSVSERTRAIDSDCTAQRHAELDERLLNEMNSIMSE